jgi:hypothetical protein
LRRTSVVHWFALAFCIGLSLASASTARTVYECKIKEQGVNRGWLPEVVVVAYETGAETAQVSDPFIQYVHGAPIDVKVKTDNAARLSLSWRLTLSSTQLDEVQLTFNFSVFKNDLRAKINAVPNGYDNAFNSSGTCKVQQG